MITNLSSFNFFVYQKIKAKYSDSRFLNVNIIWFLYSTMTVN